MQAINYKVDRMNLYERIANNIEEMILSDSSQVGQKLPSEQSLAASFNVSRNVIREALKLLQERQLITLHVGEGSYINKPSDQGMTDMLNRIVHMDNIAPSTIYELRMILEVNSCRLAAKRIKSEDDFQKLISINEQMERFKDQTDQRVQLDMEFHSMIANLSGNALLELFERSITKLIYPVILTALVPSEGNEDGIHDHQEIISVLRSGDAEKAAAIMTEHLRKSEQNYIHGYELSQK